MTMNISVFNRAHESCTYAYIVACPLFGLSIIGPSKRAGLTVPHSFTMVSIHSGYPSTVARHLLFPMSMNPGWIHASESLVPMLARGELVGSDNGKLSQAQTTLRIPLPLVYLCGMVTHFQREPPFSKAQVDWFQKLQSLYQKETAGLPHRVYHLSPTLLPTMDLRDVIHRQVTRRLEEIETQAASVQEKILAAEQQYRTTGEKARKANTRRLPTEAAAAAREPKTTKPNNNNDDGDGASDEENQSLPDDNVPSRTCSPSALDELMKPLFVTEERDRPTYEWTKVKAKKRVVEPYLLVESTCCGEDEDTAEKDKEETSSDETAIQLEEVAALEVDQIDMPLSVHVRSQIDGLISTTQISRDDRMEFDCETNCLRNKIHELESELIAKDVLLQKERVANTKALQLEKEQSHERMQSLQLRLYISETRLKTFEDALDQHLEAVANNVAIGSPERRARRMLQEQENAVATPLYSRSLRK